MYNTREINASNPLINNKPDKINTDLQGEYRCKSIKGIASRGHPYINNLHLNKDLGKSNNTESIINKHDISQKKIVSCDNISSEINILADIIKRIHTLKGQSPLDESVPAKTFNKGISELEKYVCELNTDNIDALRKLKVGIRKTFRESSKHMMIFNRVDGNINETLSQQFADIKSILIKYIDDKNTSFAICSVGSIKL